RLNRSSSMIARTFNSLNVIMACPPFPAMLATLRACSSSLQNRFRRAAQGSAEKTAPGTDATCAAKDRRNPEEIAPAYVFLASPHPSSYITGEVIPIIGGY